MSSVSCFPILVLIVTALVPVCVAFDCVKPTKDPNAPHLPAIPTDSYQAHIELNIMDKNKTWAVDEYLDYNGNRAARIIYEGNEVTKYIYSYDTDEIFTVKDQTCQVVNMSSPEGVALMFASGSRRIPNGGDRRHVFGSAATFKYAANNSDFYAGRDTVRGIPANKWSTCIPMGNFGKMQVTYFFNVPEWNMPVKDMTLPLRIEVEGNIPEGPPPGSRYFHHIYDFINYRPDIEAKSSIFETPTDVVCPGRLNTKALPVFGKTFQYRAESINQVMALVNHFSVWYDGMSRFVRIDKRDVFPQAPVYSINPVTEVHDYNTGLRYIKDRTLGNCSIHPISKDSVDSKVDPQKTIELSDPNRFFSFTKNYVYTGVRTVRGMQCDVYSAVIPNYPISGGVTANATFHYYFLTDTWNDLPLQDSSSGVTDLKYPVHLEIEVPGYLGDFGRIVNFFDFDESEFGMDVFDVSDCFDDKHKLDFRVIFPGQYNQATEMEWKYYSQIELANRMKMSPIRIGNIAISANLNNVFVSGTLLSTSSRAQFQLVNSTSPERVLSNTFFGVKLPDQCADLCVQNEGYLCQGYQYCPDDGYTCGLSRFHVLNQTMKSFGKSCHFFTRTVSDFPYKKDPTVEQAYDALEQSVNKGDLNLLIENPDGFEANFIAIGVQKLSGYSTTVKPMPSLTSQFSYRMETVVPSYTTVFDSYVWYDQRLKFVRIDSRDGNTPRAEEFSTIHDFNLGISYKISKKTDECEIIPIAPNGYDFDVNSFASKADKNGGLQIKMKSPLEIFFIDQSYTYIGQKTVRGILCDGYQADRSDFHINAFNMAFETSVFTLYFQAEPWKYMTADSLDVTKAQPVQVTIEDKTAELMMIYNVFDFNDEHHSFDYFDVSTCYTQDQLKDFEIIFKNQPFHPYLDAVEPTFKTTTILRMGEITSTSPLRFQQVSVQHDSSSVYVLVTALGNVSPMYLFQKTTNVTLAPNTKTITADQWTDCAASCVDVKGAPCNSFDFCPGGATPKCSLLTLSDETATTGRVDPNGTCVHYSRSEHGGYPLVDVETMYRAITDLVYDNLFTIMVSLPHGKNKTYVATDIRDDILRSTDPASAAGSLLKQFSKTSNKKLPDSATVEGHRRVSVTDCAMLCLTTNSLHCQSFDYNNNIGTCRLSNKHLDEITTALTSASNVNVYTSFYTRDYKQYGNVYPDNPDKAISHVTSSELCARDCNEETSFKCESFEFCPDQQTCNLRKDHSLPKMAQTPTGQSPPTCVHFSRNHLYDYNKLSNAMIVGHDDLITTVSSVDDCARMCANGELAGCASFELCQISRGDTECRLSLADPTHQHTLTRQATRGCDLYTNANPSARIPNTSGTNKTTVIYQKQTSTTSDTGPRVGIAFGTLFLGLLVGAVGMFLFSKWWTTRQSPKPDTHQLRDYQQHGNA